MRSAYWTIPNLLTMLRLALVPLLWLLAFADQQKAVGAGLAIAAATDVLDGQLARRLGQITAFGSRLDSIADTLVSFSAVGWLLILQPFLVRDHPYFFISLSIASLFALGLGWVKFRRLADFHFTSGRVAGILGYLLLIDLFLFNRYVEPMFYALMVVAWIVAIEAMLILFTRDELNERVSSPLIAYLTGPGRPSRRVNQSR